MEQTEADQFIDFLNSSPSPFHAVNSAKKLLIAAGFTPLQEDAVWSLEVGGKYFFTRNHSTIFAFIIPPHYAPGNGFNIVGAHTDSPCLKVRPISKRESQGFVQLDVETYGGGIWHTWFDRDLGFAGRVVVRTRTTDKDGKETLGLEHRLVEVKRPILRIPNLAIHLTKGDERTSFAPNTQDHLAHPILATTLKVELETQLQASESPSHPPLLLNAIAEALKGPVQLKDILDFELCLCDVQPATRGGALNEFIFSGRLDNLGMSFCALHGLIQAASSPNHKDDKKISLIALFDHEEIGSQSAYGADSNMLETTLRRISNAVEKTVLAEGVRERDFVHSFLMSADMAHACHPNYSSRHEDNFRPKMHKGPVIKYNANQRYATTAITATLFKELCRGDNIPFQEFQVRNDSPCGSTIGPILAAGCGVRTIDLGLAQLSMHSIREMMGAHDVHYGCRMMKAFLEGKFTKLDQQLKIDHHTV
eukprot:TRINITY_DN2188_c0_g2_i1.p1 TRINITY_DN2188_c0_g2~~TRINITY_DN2188_c0_g2_i1.p1  ORF type:complete len:478 (+),score=109.93 TRINITY_DN2188_c0_g2_i1:50-1483(+)